MDDSSDLLRLPSRIDSPDPVPGNPFPENDVRHEIWEMATRAADEKVCQLTSAFVGSEVGLIPKYVSYFSAKYDVWAERGVHVVLDRESVLPFDQWLANHANDCLSQLRNFHHDFFSTDDLLESLRPTLIGRREFWKAEARRFVSQQEVFQAQRSNKIGERPSSDAAPAADLNTAQGREGALSWSQKLRACRARAKLSRPQAATSLKAQGIQLTADAIKKHEEGAARPRPDVRKAYAAIYKTSEDEIFSETNIPR